MHAERLATRLSIFGARLVMLALATFFGCFAQAPASKAAPSLGKFAGTWKENESKLKMSPSNTLKFRRDAQGNLEELRGSDARPLIQPVRFDGKPYAVDGSKNTIIWKQIDKNRFERTIYENGKLLTTRRIQISDDGKTLTEDTERTLVDGKKAVTTIQFRRTTGEAQGLAAIWQAVSLHSTIPNQVTYEAMGDSLRVSTNQGVVYTAPLDGKPVAVTGPAVISGTMVALKLIDSQTMEIAQSREGVSTGKTTIAISANGKVMTTTTVNLAPNASREPSVTVFEKQ
jgi:hypothetical protein